jgi:hypothetical protein
MRRDYVDPDDYEYEPTAHDEVLQRQAMQHQAGAMTTSMSEAYRSQPICSPQAKVESASDRKQLA